MTASKKVQLKELALVAHFKTLLSQASLAALIRAAGPEILADLNEAQL